MKKYHLADIYYDGGFAISVCEGTDQYSLAEIKLQIKPLDDEEDAERKVISAKKFKKCNDGKDYVIVNISKEEKRIVPIHKDKYVYCMKYLNENDYPMPNHTYEQRIISEKKLEKYLLKGYQLTGC